MISKSERSILNIIFGASVLDRSVLESLPPHSAAGTIENVMRKTNPEAFDKGVSDFLKNNSGKDFSRRFFLMLIRSSHVYCKETDDNDIAERLSKFIELFKSFEVKPHSTLKTLHGVDINSIIDPIKIGPITIYETSRHGDQIVSLFDGCEHHFNGVGKVLVEHRSMARDYIKALELANKAFNTLDLLIAFLLDGRNKTHAAGIMHLRFDPFQRAIITSANGYMGDDDESFGFRENIDISDLLSYSTCQSGSLSSALISIVIDPTCEIERKISRAVEWVGEAYIEKNNASAFLKVAVALEVLLKVDEKGVISSSIVSSIAEQCAFLLGEDANDCLKIEGKVKELYGVRSSIVHKGSSSVEDSLLQIFLDLIRQAILKIVELKTLLDLKEIKELQSALKRKKYGGGMNQ
jgi:hypothetical protein